ncbi:MAG: Flp pilus assembly protein CpaB [Fibrobacteres bacterium]|nr:Flp pilus assembly protein CpaB [Fibrobacterota bacterium]
MIKKITENSKIAFAVSLLVGAAGAFLLYTDSQEATKLIQDKVEIFIAAANIEPGDSLNSANCETVLYPRSYVPVRTVTARQAADLKRVTASVAIPKGQPILWNCTALPLNSKGLAGRINDGERVLALGVNSEDIQSGLLRVGNYVDILATYTVPSGGKMTRTLLQNIPVLASSRTNNTATFKVTPEEAELLAFASESAKLRFTLRAVGDRTIPPETPGVDFNNLKAAEKEAVVKKISKKSDDKPLIIYD